MSATPEPQFDPLPAGVAPLVSKALTQPQVIPDPGLTVEEAEALQVIHPDRATRAVQNAAREKLRAAALGVVGGVEEV